MACTLKLSAKCNTISELITVLSRASKMISAGGRCAIRDSTGAAAFGFEINYYDDTDPWVTFSELTEGVALEFDKLNP